MSTNYLELKQLPAWFTVSDAAYYSGLSRALLYELITDECVVSSTAPRPGYRRTIRQEPRRKTQLGTLLQHDTRTDLRLESSDIDSLSPFSSLTSLSPENRFYHGFKCEISAELMENIYQSEHALFDGTCRDPKAHLILTHLIDMTPQKYVELLKAKTGDIHTPNF